MYLQSNMEYKEYKEEHEEHHPKLHHVLSENLYKSYSAGANYILFREDKLTNHFLSADENIQVTVSSGEH